MVKALDVETKPIIALFLTFWLVKIRYLESLKDMFLLSLCHLNPTHHEVPVDQIHLFASSFLLFVTDCLFFPASSSSPARL
jgi:hypothetical protein